MVQARTNSSCTPKITIAYGSRARPARTVCAPKISPTREQPGEAGDGQRQQPADRDRPGSRSGLGSSGSGVGGSPATAPALGPGCRAPASPIEGGRPPALGGRHPAHRSRPLSAGDGGEHAPDRARPRARPGIRRLARTVAHELVPIGATERTRFSGASVMARAVSSPVSDAGTRPSATPGPEPVTGGHAPRGRR